LKIPHEKFCVLPWISLETSPIGTVRPCCLAEDEIKDELGNKYKLIETDLRTVQRSDYMKNLRQQFLDGKQPQTCRKCWKEERSGRTSKRMHTLDRLKHVIADTEWTTESKSLQFLDLKLGNICNLKCRICGSWSSSNFAAEELKFDRNNDFHKQMLKDGAWPRENSDFWHNLDEIITDIKYIEFTGGEPFMIREHFQLLETVVQKGIADQVEIHYNTNGTQFPEHAEEIWKHFKTVEIAFSIDDVEDRFEYQRTNALWSEVKDNIVKFRKLRDQYPGKIQLQVCSTINVYNVMYLENLANWIDNQQFDFVYWNMLHEAYYLSVGTMPDKAKTVAIDRLQSAQVSEFHRKEFDQVIDFIGRGPSNDGQILRMKVEDLDWRRSHDLRTHHPELADAIDYQGPQR